MIRTYLSRRTTVAGLALLALAALIWASSGCATIDKASAWLADHYKPADTAPADGTTTPATGDAYAVTAGRAECRDLAVPAWLEFTITGKAAGTPEREEVVAWGYTAGGDWHGGNPAAGTYSFRAHDSRPDWAKLKTYGTDAYAGEPALKMAWTPTESYALRFAVEAGKTMWSAKRATDGAVAGAEQAAKTPDKVTICYGDPVSRKAALGAKITGVKWSDGGGK